MVIVKISLTIVFILIPLTPFILIYGVYPWYICKYKKYECELEKAQKISKMLLLKIKPGYEVFFENKVDYKLIKSEILNYIITCVDDNEKTKLYKVLNSPSFKYLSEDIKIDVVLSIFFSTGSRMPFEEYMERYPVTRYFQRFHEEITAYKRLSEEELRNFNIQIN